jgi:hypothetical protein
MTKTKVVVRVLLTRTKTVTKTLLTLIHLMQLVTADSFVTFAMKALDYIEKITRYFQILISGKNE